ncbi:MAG: hypothetical protein JNK82_24655 [Myxococcaceae bacterium]|nr:hypothetical protein [Myxococcaceae bacterium]
MDLHARLQLATQLGLYFKRHRLQPEYGIMRRQYTWLSTSGRPPMPDDVFERWCGLLQLPPFEKMFEVRPALSRCACGGPTWRVKERRLPDRILTSCLDCKREWLSL